MDGQVLAGAFEGRALSSLSLPELLALLKECVAANDQSEALLMAYLDRVHEGWREQAGTAGGSAGGATGGMSEAEALDVLGLEQGASEAAIRKAYRDLMKKHHPDQGGSAWYAARINEARNVLLDD
jgi:DnaJ-domain-containing protein 1